MAKIEVKLFMEPKEWYKYVNSLNFSLFCTVLAWTFQKFWSKITAFALFESTKSPKESRVLTHLGLKKLFRAPNVPEHDTPLGDLIDPKKAKVVILDQHFLKVQASTVQKSEKFKEVT